MQQDDVVWSVVNQTFCSYKVRSVPRPLLCDDMLSCFLLP